MEIYGRTRYEIPSIPYTQSYKLPGISNFIAPVKKKWYEGVEKEQRDNLKMDTTQTTKNPLLREKCSWLGSNFEMFLSAL